MIKNKSIVVACLGRAAATFALTGAGAWTPSYIHRTFSVSITSATAMLGCVILAAGVLGSIVGGRTQYLAERNKLFKDMNFSSCTMVVSLVFFIIGVFIRSPEAFVICIFFVLFCFFASFAPTVSFVLMRAPNNLKSTANSLFILSGHLLGDVVSAPLIGYISDKTGSLRDGLLIIGPALTMAAILFFVAGRTSETPQMSSVPS